ncbi:Nuclear factor related to kappa-B-binding protein-like protein [Drosera capensis]
MGADHRKRSLNSTGDLDHGLQEHHRAKTKIFVSQYHYLNQHISLKFDVDGKRVIAKTEQIGLSSRHLDPFVSSSHNKGALADVVAIPSGLFDPNNLKKLVSYEAWKSLLSEKERNYLKQFLPGELKPEHVLKPLLSEENLHFGNPFLKWRKLKINLRRGSSLCSGDLHPDAVLHQEQSIRANKKAYYYELQKYHDNMIENLQNMKERCANSSDPEAEILHMTRSRRVAGARERKSHYPGESWGSSSYSSSGNADEKAYSSHNWNHSGANVSNFQKRVHGKAFGKQKNEKPAASPEGPSAIPKLGKGEKHQKINTKYDDGTKYMSYVKISKSQHELVKSMKQSGNSIQAKTLNRFLGNLDNLHVKPYEMFEKEEQINILKSNLANKDLPVAYENWKNRQTWRSHAVKFLCQEIEEKANDPIEDENETPGEVPLHSQGNEGVARESISDDNAERDPSSMQGQSLQIQSLNADRTFSPVDLNAEDVPVASENSEGDDNTSDVGHASQDTPDETESQRQVGVGKIEQLHQSPVLGTWRPANARTSIPASTSNIEYVNSGNLSLRPQLAIKEEPAKFIDLKSEVPAEDPTRDFLHQQSTDLPFFNYQTRDENGLLHSLIKRGDRYPHGQRSGMDFSPTTNMLDPSPFVGNFPEQLQQPFPLGYIGHSQKVANEVFMHPSIQETVFADNNRFALPKQENLFPMGMGEWGDTRAVASTHFHSGPAETLNHNWFPVENRVQGGWPGPESNLFSNQDLGGGSGGDQGLYSVLHQCNNMHSRSPFLATTPTILTMNHGEGISSGIPRTSGLLPQVSLPFEHLSHVQGPLGVAALKANGMGWMLPRQTTTLHDPTEKPFLESWHQ